MAVPEIETERLTLRGFVDADLDPYAAIAADPEVARFVGGVLDRADAWRSLAFQRGHWELRGFGQWAVVERATGELVGRAGLYHPEGWPGTEVGWMLGRAAWGRGYATEAARAALAWAGEVLELDRIISVIDPANARSIAVAQRLGMSAEGEWESRRGPTTLYGRALPL